MEVPPSVEESWPDRPADGLVPPRVRGGMLLFAAGLAVVFLVAARLEPSPTGLGTHRQLGLPACHFLRVTGRPCPSCGMTTAFAWFARGRLDRAWIANPAGCLLAPACLAMIPWLLAGAARGRLVFTRSLERPLIGLLSATVALSLLSWMVRLLLGRVG